MKTVYVNLKVEVSDSKYSYHGQAGNGDASLEFEFPVDLLDSADAGNLYKFLLSAAIAKYRDSFKEEDENK
jgi:hypothetical protein